MSNEIAGVPEGSKRGPPKETAGNKGGEGSGEGAKGERGSGDWKMEGVRGAGASGIHTKAEKETKRK